MQTAAFILGHYLALISFAAAAWGYGRLIVARLKLTGLLADRVLSAALAIAAGMGFWIVALQLLGILGQLRAPWVLLLLVAGLALAVQALAPLRKRTRRLRLPRLTAQKAAALAAPALLLLLTALRPLVPPLAADELMYHLPNAQRWAQTGGLTLSPWLRYARFPFDYELLYAAALVVCDDVLPHLLHALAGWLVAAMIWRAGALRFGPACGIIAASLWLFLAAPEFFNASVDLGLTLFVFSCCLLFDAWLDSRGDTRLLALAAFFLGLAAGVKYHALPFLPLFGLAALLRERRPLAWLAAAGCFLLPCVYWYARNAAQTGDPFAPLGAALFGYTDLNALDFAFSRADLAVSRRTGAGMLLLLCPAILPLCRWRATPGMSGRPATQVLRRSAVFGAYAVAFWALTTGLPRYLLPAEPVLALLAAQGWLCGPRAVAGYLNRGKTRGLPRLSAGESLMIVAVLATFACAPLHFAWSHIAAEPNERDRVRGDEIPGYGAAQFLAAHPDQKLYGFGLFYEVYYVGQPVYGDYYGRWRYADFLLPPRALWQRLRDEGFGRFAVNTHLFPQVVAYPDFDDYFKEVYSDWFVRVYDIRGPLSAPPQQRSPRTVYLDHLGAARRGRAVAQYETGAALEYGWGAPRDEAEAARWYRRAAAQGQSDAARALGGLYEQGRGVAQDWAQAYFWYTLAAQMGRSVASTASSEAALWASLAPREGIAPQGSAFAALHLTAQQRGEIEDRLSANPPQQE